MTSCANHFNYTKKPNAYLRLSMKLKISSLWRTVVLAACFVLEGCSKPQSYSVYVNVVSTNGYGVVLYDFPVARDSQRYNTVDLSLSEFRVHPITPGSWEGLTVLPAFAGYEGRKLPDNITIKYQYAELSDCDSSYLEHPKKMDASGLNYLTGEKKYYTKHKCKTWNLLADRLYTKEVNLTALNSSKEMRLIGKKNHNGHRIGARLHIEFADDGSLSTRLENTTNNPWK